VAPGAQATARVWRQFEFLDGQYFSYELFVSKGQSGGAIPVEIELVDQDSRQWAAWIRMGRARHEEDLTVTFARDQLGPLLQGGWAQSPEQKLLQGTVLLPLPELRGRELTPGSRWNFSDRDGTGSASVLGECSEAGIRGVSVEFSISTARSSIQLVTCVAAEVPLALSVSTRSRQQGVTAGARLRRFQPPTRARTAPSGQKGAVLASDHDLDGLYLGTTAPDSDGVQVVAYVFRPSGRVVVNPRAFLDPDAFRRMSSPTSGPGVWRLADNFPRTRADLLDLNMAAKIRQQIAIDFGCSYGTYVQSENSIQMRLGRVEVDVGRRTVYKDVSIGAGSQSYEYTYPFRKVKGTDAVEIDGVTLVRQDDLTGRTLEAGKMESIVLNLSGQSRMVRGSFRPDGTFLLNRIGSGYTAADRESSGRYEIRGHEILLKRPGFQMERNLFGHLGKGAGGKEIVVIGRDIYPVDRIR
jgi:hypothetical protein